VALLEHAPQAPVVPQLARQRSSSPMAPAFVGVPVAGMAQPRRSSSPVHVGMPAQPRPQPRPGILVVQQGLTIGTAARHRSTSPVFGVPCMPLQQAAPQVLASTTGSRTPVLTTPRTAFLGQPPSVRGGSSVHLEVKGVLSAGGTTSVPVSATTGGFGLLSPAASSAVLSDLPTPSSVAISGRSVHDGHMFHHHYHVQ
ncbi:unnamed protein product, partial [Prorocentrum cordatum]